MKIAAFLVSRRVSEFSFTEDAARRLVERLPGATVVVCGTEKAFLKELADADVALATGGAQPRDEHEVAP